MSPNTNPAPPLSDDDERWENEASDARHKSFATAQATAAAWEKSIAAVLGAFALVAFVRGPQALSDIPTGPDSTMTVAFLGLDPARTVATLTLVSAAFVIFAVLTAALAAQGVPVWARGLHGRELRRRTRAGSIASIRYLWVSRSLTLLAAAIVFSAVAIAWIAVLGKSATPETQFAIVSSATVTACGELRSGEGGTLELVPNGGTGIAVGPASVIVLVDRCPGTVP